MRYPYKSGRKRLAAVRVSLATNLACRAGTRVHWLIAAMEIFLTPRSFILSARRLMPPARANAWTRMTGRFLFMTCNYSTLASLVNLILKVLM
jgi:hypothetical protein